MSTVGRKLVVALLVMAAPLGGLATPAQAQATPIMGRAVLIADQIDAWFQSSGRTARLAGVSVRQLAQLFIEEGAAEGVRGDVAFAQSVFETGYFAFSEAVPPEYHNYAGIGAPNNTARFPDARTGVRAQIQHLRAYADPTVGETGTAQAVVDPRFDLVNPKGQAKTVEELSGRWSGGPDYGQKIVAIYVRMREHAGPTLRDFPLAEPIVGGAIPSGQGGTWLADGIGGVFGLGAAFHGSLPQLRAAGVGVGSARTVAVASTATGNGYWLADEIGGIHGFGDAQFFGSLPALRAAGVNIGAARIVGMAVTPSGNGYWLVDESGGVHSFGDAQYFGSLPALRAAGIPMGRAPIVALVPMGDGSGYWLIDVVGGVYSFGNAQYFGSIPALRASGLSIGPASVVALVIAPDDTGYWTVDDAGGVFAFGSAPFLGSAAGAGLEIVGAVRLTGTSPGYRIVSADGAVVSYR